MIINKKKIQMWSTSLWWSNQCYRSEIIRGNVLNRCQCNSSNMYKWFLSNWSYTGKCISGIKYHTWTNTKSRFEWSEYFNYSLPLFSLVTINDNIPQTFYRSPIQMNNWTMRNNYQNLARRSLAKTRHNSISKAKRICVFLDIKKKEFEWRKNKNQTHL